MYRDPEGATKPVESLDVACREKPVHLVLGGINDFMYVSKLSDGELADAFLILGHLHRPKRTQEALLDPKSGRKFASTTMIKEAGHLVGVFRLFCYFAFYLFLHPLTFPSYAGHPSLSFLRAFLLPDRGAS